MISSYISCIVEHLDCKFDRKDLVVLAICSCFGVWYVLKKVSCHNLHVLLYIPLYACMRVSGVLSDTTSISYNNIIVLQHWIANNVLGLAFAVNGIEILQLNTVLIGCILLGGLFFYDIFWVSSC